MDTRFFRFMQGAAAAVAMVAAALSPAHAANPTVTFALANGYQVVNLTFVTSAGPSPTSETFDDVAAGGYTVTGLPGATGSTDVFCTDLFDEVYGGESWQVSLNPTADLTTAPEGVKYPVGPDNVDAIDYIAENYTTPTTSPADEDAAQLALWDLAEGGKVTDSHGAYSFSSQFSAVDSGYATLSDISNVYIIEQKALTAKTSSNSVWLDPVTGSYPGFGRPQDFVTAGAPKLTPFVSSAPEPASLSIFAFVALGTASLVLRKRRQAQDELQTAG